MGTLATRLEKIEAQTNEVAKYSRLIGDAIRQFIMEDTDARADLRTARDHLWHAHSDSSHFIMNRRNAYMVDNQFCKDMPFNILGMRF